MQVSFSKMQTFHQCKYQFWQSYVLTKDDPRKLPKEENAFAEYGSFVHSLLEKHAKGELEVYELSQEYVRRFSLSVLCSFPESAFVDMEEQYYNDGLKFFDNYDGLYGYKIIGIEDEFCDSVSEDISLKGFIDLVLEDSDGRLIIQDWKSKSRFKTKKEQREYARQLYLYSLHVKNKYERYPDVLRFYMFRKQNVVDIPFDENDFQEAMDWMNQTASQISSCEEWTPSCDEWFCTKLCDYRNSCPYSPEVIENSNRSEEN